jgi:RNA polymerase sigma-70 factor (sigma-E family)
MAWTAADGRAADTGDDAGASATVRHLASVWTDPAAPTATTGTSDCTEAVRELYERSHADMVRFAAFLTGDVDAAEDLAHEAYVRVFDAWDRIEDPTKADAYLKTTIVNLVKSGYRRREVADRKSDRHLAAVASAEDDALGQLGRARVLAAVAALPLRQRSCVVMRHWMRMTESEIAETLDVSIGSVRTHVKRGTATLKDRLGA